MMIVRDAGRMTVDQHGYRKKIHGRVFRPQHTFAQFI